MGSAKPREKGRRRPSFSRTKAHMQKRYQPFSYSLSHLPSPPDFPCFSPRPFPLSALSPGTTCQRLR